MIRNITHREAGEDSKVIKVHFTESQKAVIKLVCGQQESADKPGYIPKLTYPYVKLKLVPTRITSTKKPKKKWAVLTQFPITVPISISPTACSGQPSLCIHSKISTIYYSLLAN